MICDIEGCENPAKSRGWCDAHYSRYKRHGSPYGGGAPRPRLANRVCLHCPNPVVARGLCGIHNYRFRKYGDPLLTDHPQEKPIDKADGFWEQVDRYTAFRFANYQGRTHA